MDDSQDRWHDAVDEIVEFRQQVLDIVRRKGDARELFKVCDKVRDEVLLKKLGVKLEDGGKQWTMSENNS